MAQHRTHGFRIVAAGDSAVVVEFEECIDADRFETLCAQAARAGDPRLAIISLRDALACWRGGAF